MDNRHFWSFDDDMIDGMRVLVEKSTLSMDEIRHIVSSIAKEGGMYWTLSKFDFLSNAEAAELVGYLLLMVMDMITKNSKNWVTTHAFAVERLCRFALNNSTFMRRTTFPLVFSCLFLLWFAGNKFDLLIRLSQNAKELASMWRENGDMKPIVSRIFDNVDPLPDVVLSDSEQKIDDFEILHEQKTAGQMEDLFIILMHEHLLYVAKSMTGELDTKECDVLDNLVMFPLIETLQKQCASWTKAYRSSPLDVYKGNLIELLSIVSKRSLWKLCFDGQKHFHSGLRYLQLQGKWAQPTPDPPPEPTVVLDTRSDDHLLKPTSPKSKSITKFMSRMSGGTSHSLSGSSRAPSITQI